MWTEDVDRRCGQKMWTEDVNRRCGQKMWIEDVGCKLPKLSMQLVSGADLHLPEIFHIIFKRVTSGFLQHLRETMAYASPPEHHGHPQIFNPNNLASTGYTLSLAKIHIRDHHRNPTHARVGSFITVCTLSVVPSLITLTLNVGLNLYTSLGKIIIALPHQEKDC